jgi:hypothetical protein
MKAVSYAFSCLFSSLGLFMGNARSMVIRNKVWSPVIAMRDISAMEQIAPPALLEHIRVVQAQPQTAVARSAPQENIRQGRPWFLN